MLSRWDDRSRASDDALIDALPAGLSRAVEDAVADGGTVASCVLAAEVAGATPLLLAAVEALAERRVAERDAARN